MIDTVDTYVSDFGDVEIRSKQIFNWLDKHHRLKRKVGERECRRDCYACRFERTFFHMLRYFWLIGDRVIAIDENGGIETQVGQLLYGSAKPTPYDGVVAAAIGGMLTTEAPGL